MDIVVSQIATRVFVESDDDGDTSYAIKALVENHSEDEDVFITLQAVDADDFEVATVNLSGTVPPGGQRTITTRRFMNAGEFSRIDRWQIP